MTRDADRQLSLFPSTRYHGSKRKLLPWIHEALAPLEFDRCLDLFSGSASVSYLLKAMGKSVTTNDLLGCNRAVAGALVVNEGELLRDEDMTALFERRPGRRYASFIQETFRDLFFLEAENAWLDVVAQNIAALDPGPPKDLAHFALFQACLAKRPYNLFHRANLYMRTAEVRRSFGNKTTWDRPFPQHVLAALAEARRAVFASGRRHRALRGDYREVPGEYELVYVDPPYIDGKGRGVDYLDFYHFLEGLVGYGGWAERVDMGRKHRPFRRIDNPWTAPARVLGALDEVVDRHRRAIIVLSYRSDGIPPVDELVRALARHGRPRCAPRVRAHQYALSRRRAAEVLLVSVPYQGRRSPLACQKVPD